MNLNPLTILKAKPVPEPEAPPAGGPGFPRITQCPMYCLDCDYDFVVENEDEGLLDVPCPICLTVNTTPFFLHGTDLVGQCGLPRFPCG